MFYVGIFGTVSRRTVRIFPSLRDLQDKNVFIAFVTSAVGLSLSFFRNNSQDWSSFESQEKRWTFGTQFKLNSFRLHNKSTLYKVLVFFSLDHTKNIEGQSVNLVPRFNGNFHISWNGYWQCRRLNLLLEKVHKRPKCS